MNLEELLEYTAKEYLDDRTDLLDGEPDELWPDRVLVRYFNEAQRRLCRRSWVLIDVGHPQAGVIVLKTNTALYPLHKSVLRVYRATPEDTDVSLARTTDERLTLYQAADPPYFDVNISSTLTPGRPVAIATDAGFRLARVRPTPSATENGLRLLLKVARMPNCELTLEEVQDSPEVPEEFHMDVLCKYAAGRCLTHPNVDATAKTEGRRLLDEVEEAIKEARQDRERAEMAPVGPLWASTTASL